MWRPHEAGWFEAGPTPGEFGPTVLMGHVDTERSGPAVFYPLKEIDEGDRIEVTRKEVFGIEPEPALRLITCGGAFDRESGDYTENLVVFATYTGHREATEKDRDRPLHGRDHFR